ncbi:MAG: 4a-hydroxytetrahydrobiopterin dehydratase [Gemmatimonadetes bacterium]|nr:4a-hydroxytetrahydrobiopterin dehydratase [Gemmatimonadota bacterium]NIR80912.1 4a-hydroxytetrahydrobiopterin dehydratase [Gemmatimonadota bacterium]NIT89730.1 4a-hydroxytetrahydrobiopterin dehydratase [Gemmatimonadota bacterium]NIU33516.1 4a-hydroxytetrahydrobiopterin dehydratase [Gemmatimonadota bacterium]NIU37786.1 4a-hydroxytetrahydrobiopterin dehydratase [Gemmatimonadota bacterium]
MATELVHKHCEPCSEDTPPLTGDALEPYQGQLSGRWEVKEEHHLVGTFEFADFVGALAFTNRVGELAEAEGHHPEICLTWGRATVKIWTHAIDGLSENDFILAAKIDESEGVS